MRNLREYTLMLLAVCALIGGCIKVQPESAKTVAAFDVPLTTPEDRYHFLSVLRAAAEVDGMHVDATSVEDLASESKASPNFQMTMNAAVWCGAKDDEAVASAMDHFDHLGKVWLTFFKGKYPPLVARFQERAMLEIKLRWPGTLSLPIMPSGAIPLYRDLVATPTGYIVKPSEAHKYDVVSTEARLNDLTAPHSCRS